MKAKVRLASMALLGGLSTAAVVGGATAAHATGGYSCTQNSINIVTCNNFPVTVVITEPRVLTGTELSVLENNLDNTSVDVTAIKNTVINTEKSFDPVIDLPLTGILVDIL